MKVVKYSKQREAIKDFLTGNTSHPTADAIYSSIREEFPNVSLGTVYRNLNMLVESGDIRKITFTQGPDHFDYDTTPHYHFICRGCGKIFDIPADIEKVINSAAESKAPGYIESHDLVYYGICKDCMEHKDS